MVLDRASQCLPSAAFFCPQSKAPDEQYLVALHAFLRSSLLGRKLLQHVADLQADGVWGLYASAREDVAALSQGPRYVDMLRAWATDGTAGPLATARSGIVALPLLVILQVGQYLAFLGSRGLSHRDFLAAVRDSGGLQGYCGGLPSATAIACADDEGQVVENAAVAIRILVGVGAYGEAADDPNSTGSTTLALRLKYEGQGHHLTHRFPGTHVSAITDPRSVSIVGPAGTLDQLSRFASDQGLQVHKMDIRGKVHNPENEQLAAELSRLCNSTPCLRLPEASRLQVPVRSNRHGDRLLHGSLSEEVITTILASRCDWFTLLGRVAEDVASSPKDSHEFIVFGLGDCVPMMPFHKHSIRTTKTDAQTLIQPQERHCDGMDAPAFPDEAIAIVGASCRFPEANNLEELWALLAGGTDCHQELPTDRFDLRGSFRASQSGTFAKGRSFYGNFLRDIRRFDHAFFGVTAREAANMDPQQRIMLELSYEALEAAGYLASHSRHTGDDVGCFIGASLVEYLDNTGAHPPTAYTSTGTIRAFLCGRLSHFYGWSGPAEVIDTACSSSLVAINRACKAIQTGECRMALAGGVNAITGINNYLDLGKAGFLSPTGQCKPFDASADGYCRSDGAGLVVLKKLSQAVHDGDHLLGVIAGIATNQGGMSASITVPDPNAQRALYRKVMAQAGLRPDQVTYVEAHGTGTQAGDPLEMDSVRSVFGSPSRPGTLYIGSVKGSIGHCETAAGVAGLLKALAMIQHGQIPPQASHDRLNPKIGALEPDGLAITQKLVDWNVPFRAALVNSYGAAGSNCALLCCEMPRPEGIPVVEERPRGVLLPLVVTASSRTSLVENSRALGAHLRRNMVGMDLADVAFTLNERRQRLKFTASFASRDVESAAKLLESFDASESLQTTPTCRPTVFVFGGQSDNKVALDRSFYDSFPALQSHIRACDVHFRELGYPSVIPAMFQPEPIHDITVLQCSIFALQYACARCWIDAGLRPKAIIGHSLGEITALAVSGVLSFSDGIKLVAARARLIESKWGADRGGMLALSCTVQEFESLSSLLQPPGKFRLEIACHNSPTSIVAAGPSAAVDAAERLLRSNPSLRMIRYQRLNTSHGFHSALVEPILTDLATVSKTLQWNEPRIPLETCTRHRVQTMQDYEVTRHARDPVLFCEAIWRLEERLGPLLWLEAGVDTAAVAMARKASRRPETHVFQPLKTKRGQAPADAISHVMISLAANGIFARHWSFLPVQSRQRRSVWLPPYQFEKSQHWLANIDRVVEMQQTCATTPSAESQVLPPPQLVTRKTDSSRRPGVTKYLVNIQSQRFKSIVSGHAVRSRPLCPASMYMECAAMALQQLLGESALAGVSLTFEQLHFHNALGVESQGEVVLELGESINKQSWDFTIRTSASTDSKHGEISHASGSISLAANPMLQTLQRIISGSVLRMEKEDSVERLMSTRAYKLFARIVDYQSFFRGIQSIILDDSQALATIRLPGEQPGREESTAWKVCDAVLVDVFIQVVGLLINTSDSVSSGSVAVMVGLERVVISPGCEMHDSASWKVYAKFDAEPGQQPVGDVFVYSPLGEMVAILCGCRFTSLHVSQLERALDSVGGSTARQAAHVPLRIVQESLAVSSSVTGDVDTPATNSPAQAASDLDSVLKSLLADYTGVDAAAILPDAVLADVGLDSLAAVELVGELSSRFGLDISSMELSSSTLHSLSKSLGTLDSLLLDTESVYPLHRAPSCSQTTAELRIRPDEPTPAHRRKMLQMIADIAGASIEDIQPSSRLADLGLDSLSSVDLKQELEDCFSVSLDEELPRYTVQELITHLETGPCHAAQSRPRSLQRKNSNNAPEAIRSLLEAVNPFDALGESNATFETSATRRGFLGYWSDVAPIQDELLVAYIVEGLCDLGVNLKSIACGDRVPDPPYRADKYDRLVPRLWKILQNHQIVSISQAGVITRGSRLIDKRPSSLLQAAFEAQFPLFRDEASLIGLTGPRLADCLSGKADAVSIMFGSPVSLGIMEDFYSQSPMMSTMTEQLVNFLMSLLRGPRTTRRVRILEVGAGTGGTTKRLAEALDSAGISTQYTFTDISASLVSKAKHKFERYPWMEYATFNLEKDVPDVFRHRFDIVISANCVHATTDRIASSRRLGQMLAPGGLVVLSEVTRVIDWYDICFGLLDGWWLVDGRKSYPLQPAAAWMSTFEAAGFASAGYSQGSTPEANTQQLLVACNKDWDISAPATFVPGENGLRDCTFRLETMVYKETDAIQIHADVFFPKRPPTLPMPIALMIHGGGHMTLSRRAIRPAQTQHLIAHGFLPVSIDYRLCPEVTLTEGPMTDVCDAYRWVQTALPQRAALQGFSVDSGKVVAIGWSTGGHLAMSLGWTAERAGLPPPAAVLSFYAPVDFESGELDSSRLVSLPKQAMTLERIISALPAKPVTNYECCSKGDETNLGWVRPGDARSELIMALFKEGIGLPLLLNGLPGRSPHPLLTSSSSASPSTANWLAPPPPERVASISPLAQLRAGHYKVPTYIIHGTDDQIAPFAGAERFVSELAARGIMHGFLALIGVGHVHDLKVKPESQEWDSQVGPGYQFLFQMTGASKMG